MGPMIDRRELRSVTEFEWNIKKYVGRPKKKTPLVLTMNSHAKLIVQDAETYQEMLDRLERAETIAAIRRGMKDAEEGRVLTLDQAVKRLRKKYGT
jgi:predicted transcriptional regulator